ncbi:alpha/beta fold hydrolase [Kordiimonas aestuarii]|uniref:alpha/beta fold hydrolase n=1 Tax=Kordiimonas aestuarii TaxID=1005925 RepID=UPI0021D2090E|nr:alpha/beta hydrolase [Kordiimonas aestuarii]
MLTIKTVKKLMMTLALPLVAISVNADANTGTDGGKVRYRTAMVGEVNMFYREAGPKDAPVVLLLHGFPTSSHMYRNLIPELSGSYHVIAPDLPGFGSTTAPPRGQYEYSFDNLSKAVEGLTEVLDIEKYAVMVFDYGAPVGFRLAAANPGKVAAIITQNGNAYEEGLMDAWGPIRAYWQDPSQKNRDTLRALLTADFTKFQYTHGTPADRLGPDAWTHDQAILDRDAELQLDLFGDYKSNVALYPMWQAYLREYRPALLAVWGTHDPFFGPAGAEAFKRDIPDAEVHLYDAGHFALESHGKEIAGVIKNFLAKKLK